MEGKSLSFLAKPMFWGVFALLILVVGGGFYLIERGYKVEGKEIHVNSQGGERVVVNVADGFQVHVSKEWDASIGISEFMRMRIDLAGESQPDTPSDLVDGAIFRVYVDINTGGLSLEDWVIKKNFKELTTLNFQNLKSYKEETKLLEEDEKTFDLIEVDDSKVISIFLQPENNKIYELQCLSRGLDYLKLIIECENVMKTFAFTN